MLRKLLSWTLMGIGAVFAAGFLSAFGPIGLLIGGGLLAASMAKKGPNGEPSVFSKLKSFLSSTARLQKEIARRDAKIDKINNIHEVQKDYVDRVKKADPLLAGRLTTQFRAEALRKIRNINNGEVAKAQVRADHPLATKLPGVTTAIRFFK